MKQRFRLTLAQINPTVGDLDGNIDKAQLAWEHAQAAGAQMVALPEMFITGYQTQDLVRKPAFHHAAMAAIKTLAHACVNGPAIGVGGPYVGDDGRLFNAYYICQGGKVTARFFKRHLPNFHVFDEIRLFSSGRIADPHPIGPARIGCPICEDAWRGNVCKTMVERGAEILMVPNGSPYFQGKLKHRLTTMRARVMETGVPLVYINMVGAQDDQVFDGGSFVLDSRGQKVVQLPLFDETVEHLDFHQSRNGWQPNGGLIAGLPSELEQDYRAMVEGLRDYVRKSGFQRVLLGLSGGVDSALVATIAVDALGAKNVQAVMLPSQYTSEMSLKDAADVARHLHICLNEMPIAAAYKSVTGTLAPLFGDRAPDVTEENIQSRLRGLLLMALSNKFGAMLLTTGNKSEIAVGYATIYGDMAGGYNPIKDLYKTRVFAVARWRNQNRRVWMQGPDGVAIPPRIIDKPPSAELRPDQRDDDSLPPYPTLDAILQLLIDADASVADCVHAGFDRETVQRVERLIYYSEYKRFQSAPGPRLTSCAFWLDRRYPIVNRWRDRG